MITESDISRETLTAKLFDRAWRTDFCDALAQEHGSALPLFNAFFQASRCAQATPEQLRELVELLLAEDHEELVGGFVSHPEMPLDVLLELCDAGRCVDALGHRTGPRELLERVIDRHGYDEAILTMALDLYGDPKVCVDEFAAFLRRHSGHGWMMRTLARHDASERAKEVEYEALLSGHEAAVASRALYLTETSWRDVEDLKQFLECYPLPEVYAKLINAGGNPDKQQLVENLSASHADHPDVAVALHLRGCLERAWSEGLSSTAAEELLAADDPRVLIALAENPHTPPEMLERLSAVHDRRHARTIRRRALKTIRSLKRRSR